MASSSLVLRRRLETSISRRSTRYWAIATNFSLIPPAAMNGADRVAECSCPL